MSIMEALVALSTIILVNRENPDCHHGNQDFLAVN